MTANRFPVDKWLAAWTEGVQSFWPATTPNEIERLLRVRDSLMFTAPEEYRARCAQAWEVYCETADGDSPIAHAALALAYIIAAARQP